MESSTHLTHQGVSNTKTQKSTSASAAAILILLIEPCRWRGRDTASNSACCHIYRAEADIVSRPLGVLLLLQNLFCSLSTHSLESRNTHTHTHSHTLVLVANLIKLAPSSHTHTQSTHVLLDSSSLSRLHLDNLDSLLLGVGPRLV
jgi:hypothetical protein